MTTALLIKSAECRVGCAYEGYDTGEYAEKTKQCACVDFLDHDLIVIKKKHIINKSSQSEDF